MMVIYEHGSLKSRLARYYKRVFEIVLPNLNARRAWNLFKLSRDRARLRPHVTGRPHTIYLEVSSICNLRCPGCLSYDKTYHAHMLPLDEFRKILDHYAPWMVDLELYGWGEPFLNRDIFEMIRYAKGKRLFVRTSSNFNAFKEGDHEKIVQSGLNQINASLDGTTQEVYGQYRVGASLDKALENLRKLIETRRQLGSLRPLIEWQFIVSKVNYSQIKDVRRLAAETGVDILRLDLPFSLTHINQTGNSEAEARWLAEDPAFRQWEGSDKGDAAACMRECSYLWGALQVDAMGQVNPCPNRIGSKVQCGDAVGIPVRDMWNSAVFVEGRKMFAQNPSGPPEFDGPCRVCKEGLQPWKIKWPDRSRAFEEQYQKTESAAPK